MGADLVRVDIMVRLISRYGEYFFKILYTDLENDYCKRNGTFASESYAALFAAKEEAFKALHFKSQEIRIRWHVIEVINDQKLLPNLELHRSLSDITKSDGLESLSVSLTRKSGYALAVVAATFNTDRAQKKVNLWELCSELPL